MIPEARLQQILDRRASLSSWTRQALLDEIQDPFYESQPTRTVIRAILVREFGLQDVTQAYIRLAEMQRHKEAASATSPAASKP